MRSRAGAGFGEATRGKATTMGNPYALITTVPRDGGFDVVVSFEAKDREAVRATEGGERSATIRFREDHGPRIGERVMIGRSLVKVADKRYDQSGAIHVLDEDTRAWHKWPS